jgi:GNAT superfamily N-acetyltransferase
MTFQLERWDDFWRDGQEIFPIHFEELALHKDRIPLGMDDSLYRQMEAAGTLYVLTARVDWKLVGYYVAIIIPNHPHNKDAGKVSNCDMFYLLPEYRRGGNGAKLLIMAEKSLRKLGVTKASMSVKLHQNHANLLKALGWEPTDLVLQKIL